MDASKQVVAYEAELRHLRIKVEADEKVMMMLKQQNAQLQNDIEEMHREHTTEIRQLRHERDEAKSSCAEIESILNQTANFLAQGLRARIGNRTPQELPDRQLKVVDDERLPKNIIG